MNTFDVVIIGGGIAGNVASVHLARAGWDVLLMEKKSYPFHRLCGEFLSPEMQRGLADVGAIEAIRAIGAKSIRRVRLTEPGGAVFESNLPGTALGISRFRLDPILADSARRAGATVREGVSAREIHGDPAAGFDVISSEGAIRARCVVGAWGKRSSMDRKLDRAFFSKKSPFVAFKSHYEGGSLPETIELHAFDGGYCGLSEVEGDRINVCWIARLEALKAAGGNQDAMVENTFGQNARLADRMAGMRRVPGTECAVSQVSFSVRTPFEDDVCMIGDTAGTIAPLCGDGMAMAVHSAELASEHISAFLRGSEAPEAFRERYAAAWRRLFSRRISLGSGLHRGFVHPVGAAIGLRILSRAPGLGRWVIRQTRG